VTNGLTDRMNCQFSLNAARCVMGITALTCPERVACHRGGVRASSRRELQHVQRSSRASQARSGAPYPRSPSSQRGCQAPRSRATREGCPPCDLAHGHHEHASEHAGNAAKKHIEAYGNK
jgi:hypothetical protein